MKDETNAKECALRANSTKPAPSAGKGAFGAKSDACLRHAMDGRKRPKDGAGFAGEGRRLRGEIGGAARRRPANGRQLRALRLVLVWTREDAQMPKQQIFCSFHGIAGAFSRPRLRIQRAKSLRKRRNFTK